MLWNWWSDYASVSAGVAGVICVIIINMFTIAVLIMVAGDVTAVGNAVVPVVSCIVAP